LRSYTLDTVGVVSKVRSFVLYSLFTAGNGNVAETPGRVDIYGEVVVWKRLQHPNIVPFLGVPTKLPPFEIICDWMEKVGLLILRKHPQEDRIGLVSESF